jgi:stalled ribosome rescue protein Dom34
MRTNTLVSTAKTSPRWLADRAGTPSRDAWRMRALREASIVRRVLRGLDIAGSSTVGETDTMAALERSAVNELLITRRFTERRPSASTVARGLAAFGGVRTTIVTGVAALELDLAGDGIGAVLRRSLPISDRH